jgi:2-iminobutanoate/2-iminopropanoate deaminase
MPGYDQTTRPEGPFPVVGYSHSVRVGDTVYISGQTPLDGNGQVTGVDDFAVQFAQVFSNLEVVLRGHGVSYDQLVKTTAFLTNAEDWPTYRELRDKTLRNPYPASTLVIVSGLVRPEFLLEVEAVAVVPRERVNG